MVFIDSPVNGQLSVFCLFVCLFLPLQCLLLMNNVGQVS